MPRSLAWLRGVFWSSAMRTRAASTDRVCDRRWIKSLCCLLACLLPALVTRAQEEANEEANVVYADFEKSVDANFWHYHWGNGGRCAMAVTSTPVRTGSGAGRLHYGLAGTNSFLVMGCNTPLPPDARTVQLWVYGDNSSNSLQCRIIDRSGETFLYPLGPKIDWSGWKSFTLDVTAPEQTWGGNKDKTIDDPARLAIQINAGGRGEGDLYLDDIVVHARVTEKNRVGMELAGEPIGNIWFGAQRTVEIPARLINRSAKSAVRMLTYRVADNGDRTLLRGTQTVEVVGGQTATARIPIETKGLFGCYRVTADLRTPDGVSFKRLATTAAVVPATSEVPAGSDPFGMNLSLARRCNGADQDAIAALARASGMAWSREEFSWDLIEPVKGTFVWDSYDRALAVAKSQGIGVLGLLAYSASWARQDPKAYASPPRDVNDFAAFVYQVVSRYKHQVKHWEIWNEPDSRVFWPPNPDAAAYTALLNAAYQAAKRADPECHVMTAGLLVGMCHRDNWTYLNEMYKHGARESFDILAWHAYCDPLSPDQGGYATRLATLKSIMAKHGDAGKPIWLTEEGWPTAPGNAHSVTELEQAQNLVRAHILALAAPDVQRFFWFLFRDGGNRESDYEQSYGVLNPDNTPKTAFCAYVAMTHILQGKTSAGLVPLGSNLTCYAFGGGGEAALVLWHPGSASVRVAAEGGAGQIASLLDWCGNPVTNAASGKLDLTVGSSPVYILALQTQLEALRTRLAAATQTVLQPAAPAYRTARVIETFADIHWGSDWKLGWMGSGHEGTVLSSSPQQRRNGTNSGKLAYQADPAKGKYGLCYVQVDRMLDLPDDAKAVGIWVYGDNSGNNLALRTIDRNDQVFQYALAGKVDWTGWKYLEAQLDKPAGVIKGPKNARMEFPIRLQGLIVGIVPARKTEGVIFFKDLTVKD